MTKFPIFVLLSNDWKVFQLRDHDQSPCLIKDKFSFHIVSVPIYSILCLKIFSLLSPLVHVYSLISGSCNHVLATLGFFTKELYRYITPSFSSLRQLSSTISSSLPFPVLRWSHHDYVNFAAIFFDSRAYTWIIFIYFGYVFIWIKPVRFDIEQTVVIDVYHFLSTIIVIDGEWR